MTIESDRFGTIDLEDRKLISFPVGLPGFEELREFIILEINESKPLYWLQSIENKHVCLPAVIPFEFMDDYFLEIRDHELDELKIESKSDLLIMNIVVIPEDITKMTANMAAPIVVNAKLGIGKQIIIDAKELPIRFPIYELIMNKLKEESDNAGSVAQEG